jgi:hypothetical protein
MFVVFMVIAIELNHESLLSGLVIAVGAAAGAAFAARALGQLRRRQDG